MFEGEIQKHKNIKLEIALPNGHFAFDEICARTSWIYLARLRNGDCVDHAAVVDAGLKTSIDSAEEPTLGLTPAVLEFFYSR